MILNLEDLILSMKEIVGGDLHLEKRLLIQEPGISEDEYIDLIKAFPTLPSSYLNFIKTYDVKQVSIGNYRISVCKDKQEETVDRLLYWNDREEEIQDIQKLHDLTFIASSDIYDIYVAGTQSDYKEGEILSIDHELYWEEEVPIKRIAPDYETFLIICANKYQLQLAKEIEDDKFLDELRMRLDALNLPKEYYDYWVGKKN